MVCKPTANGTESGQYVKNCCTASLGRQFIQNSRSAQTTGIQTPAETRPGVEVDLPPPAKTESYLGHHQLEPSQVPFAVNMPRISLPGSSLLVVLALILCLSLPIRAVPTSVLAQDTELSTSANHKLQQQQQQQQHHQQQLQQQQQQQQPAAGKCQSSVQVEQQLRPRPLLRLKVTGKMRVFEKCPAREGCASSLQLVVCVGWLAAGF